MDTRLLIEENFHVALTLLSPSLYHISDDKTEIWFHDENAYNLFFIHLNEYINTLFTSPLDNTSKLSLFKLTLEFSSAFENNASFKKFIDAGKSFKTFLFEKRFYDKYISPYEIKIETCFAELINIQANYNKHSLYHLGQMKKKLKRMFKLNGIENVPEEDYNEHLQYFKDAVLDDRLNFNQTKIVEEVGKFFLALYDLVHCDANIRISMAIQSFIREHGRTVKWRLEPPPNMSKEELFYWEIKALSCWRFDKNRLIDFIPTTGWYLIEK